MPGGGLLQLVAYGSQDAYLTGNPTITFWRTTYRRHTNFNVNNNQANVYPTVQLNQIDNIDSWITVYRIIKETDRNTECPISLEIINPNSQYCICAECKYNFSKNEIKTAFETHNQYKCPMCRADWTDKTVYINGAKPELKKKKTTDPDKKTKSNTNKSFNGVEKTRHNKRFFYGK